jgi:Transposase
MREGNQNDKIDARRLAELLRLNHLNPVYHGEHGLRTLKELVRSYLTITKDLARVKSRVKAIYRSWAIPCTGKEVYARCHREEWLGKITEPGVRRRAEFYYQQLDALRLLALDDAMYKYPRSVEFKVGNLGPGAPTELLAVRGKDRSESARIRHR